MKPTLLLTSLSLLVCGALRAQQAVPSVTIQIDPGAGGGVVDPATLEALKQAAAEAAAGNPQQPTPPAQPQTNGAAQKTPEQQRLEKFMKLGFDRRPSAMLSAWSMTEEEALKPKEPKPGRAGQPAVDENGNPVPAPPEGAKPPEPDPIDRELLLFQRWVTLGQWKDVAGFFDAKFANKETDAKNAYKFLLTGLAGRPRISPEEAQQLQRSGGGNPNSPFGEQNVLMPDDVLGLADASPVELDDELIASLAGLLSRTKSQGNFMEELVGALKAGTARLGGEDPKKKFAAARLLIGSDSAAEAGPFLPDPEAAAKDENVEALNLLALYYLALRDEKDDAKKNLEKAWDVNQRILAAKELKEEEREEALARAVELAPQVREELGDTWLSESFTRDARRGREVLATIGSRTARGRAIPSADFRLKNLQLQSTAVEALLKVDAERATEWAGTLNVLAINWLNEALYSYQMDKTESMQPQMRYDPYGNMYYDQSFNRMNPQQNDGNRPQPVPTNEVLEIHPGADWLARVDASLRPKFSMVLAQLFLKVGEDEKAFPFIEDLASSRPETALELANEFIRVWTRNHDPNNEKRRTGMYMYFYGYSQRAESIPLTRSKQVRNLEDLAQWLKRLHALPIGPLDENAVATAFVTTHSVAEVYRLDDIEKVFGAIDTLKPETLAMLVETMRANLAALWRAPKVQQQQKTKRTDKDIEAEVVRGYEVATSTLAFGLGKYPESWKLQLVNAALLFDENNYKKELAASSKFTGNRTAAFAEFEKAAVLYAKALPELEESEENSSVFDIWFYASLGASDIGALKAEQVPDAAQQEKIKAAILALPGDAAERHLARFANSLSSRMTSVAAELKQRFLRAGLAIVGDHKQAAEARKLFDYYEDLVSEVKLAAEIDGADTVGSAQPFGLFVNLLHTTQIEREADGFTKYFSNQNNNPYAYNYGRPTENYRDKFEESARNALAEHFEVLSVTFHSEKVQSRGTDEEGWRVTPYAYILMKPKGPEVDAIPPLRLDLDFLDTSGYVVLPIESPKIPIEAREESASPRPVGELVITETLDERKAAEGKLLLEIKATGHGLVPPLEKFLKVDPADFEVVNIDDKGLAVVQLDAESDENAAISERNWVVELAAREGLAEKPTNFRFATPLVDVKEVTYQRYDDADMVAAEAEVSLENEYGKPVNKWLVAALAGGGLLILGLAVVFLSRRTGPPAAPVTSYALPEEITPFTVISLLQRIRDDRTLRMPDTQREELTESIRTLERDFFAASAGPGGATDLREIAQSWVRRAA